MEFGRARTHVFHHFGISTDLEPDVLRAKLILKKLSFLEEHSEGKELRGCLWFELEHSDVDQTITYTCSDQRFIAFQPLNYILETCKLKFS